MRIKGIILKGAGCDEGYIIKNPKDFKRIKSSMEFFAQLLFLQFIRERNKSNPPRSNKSWAPCSK